MKNNGMLVLVIALALSALLFLIFRAVRFFASFNRKTRLIVGQMRRAADEQQYAAWREVLRCHYLCILPFVTERNAPRLYHRLHRRPHRADSRRRDRPLFHLLAPSLLGVCVCALCLCGVSWAWFGVSVSTGNAELRAASFTATVTATLDETPLPTAAADGSTSISLDADRTYRITITPDGTATSGYCRIVIGGTVCYTDRLTAAAFTFTLRTGDGATLTVTPQWGTCTDADADNTIADGDTLDLSNAPTEPTEPTETAAEPTNAVTEPTDPADDAPAPTEPPATETPAAPTEAPADTVEPLPTAVTEVPTEAAEPLPTEAT